MEEKMLNKIFCELKESDNFVLMLICSLSCFIYTLFFCLGISLILHEIYLPQVYFVGFWKSFLIKGLRNFFFVAVVSAGEEVIWRILPLTFIVWLKNKIQKEDLGDLILLSIVFLSSYCFGLSHAVPFNVLIQGVFGLVWSFLFLKTGGYNQHYFKASLYMIFSHLFYNALVLSNGYLFVKFSAGL